MYIEHIPVFFIVGTPDWLHTSTSWMISMSHQKWSVPMGWAIKVIHLWSFLQVKKTIETITTHTNIYIYICMCVYIYICIYIYIDAPCTTTWGRDHPTIIPTCIGMKFSLLNTKICAISGCQLYFPIHKKKLEIGNRLLDIHFPIHRV